MNESEFELIDRYICTFVHECIVFFFFGNGLGGMRTNKIFQNIIDTFIKNWEQEEEVELGRCGNNACIIITLNNDFPLFSFGYIYFMFYILQCYCMLKRSSGKTIKE